jgi:hypothetical protein
MRQSAQALVIMNEYVNDLVSTLKARFSIEAVGMETGDWICANTKFRQQPFSFKGYEFQRAIANDLHPNLDVLKISQVGLTEIQMRKACALLSRNPTRVGMFTLADEKMYRKFSQTRLRPMMDENPVFSSGGEGIRSIETVQIGPSFLHIINATANAATSTSADFVFNDEVDSSDQTSLALFASRLQNSDWRMKQRFSTPSWAGFGIDGTYGVSDMREYVCKCSSCNHYQIPIFSRNFVRIPGMPDRELLEIDDDMLEGLDLAGSYVWCEKCNAPLDLEFGHREWVATYPSRVNARGYRVRAFTSPRISIPYIVGEMLSYKRRDYIRGWYNTVIGDPYTDSQARLDEAQIKKVMGSPQIADIPKSTRIYVGIDMGATCHITLCTEDVVFAFYTVKASSVVSEVDVICKRYNVISGTVDRHPYEPTANEIRDISGGRIMPMEYRGDKELSPVKDAVGTTTHWQCNRTKAIDEVVKRIRATTIRFEGYGNQNRVLIEHLRDMVREETAEKPATWTKLTGTDHYFHSLAFLLLGMKLVDVAFQLSGAETRSTAFVAGLHMQTARGLNQQPRRIVR